MYRSKDEYQDYYITHDGDILVGTERDDFKRKDVPQPENLLATFRVIHFPNPRAEIIPKSGISREKALEVIITSVENQDSPEAQVIAKELCKIKDS